jgi:hypothetical protein
MTGADVPGRMNARPIAQNNELSLWLNVKYGVSGGFPWAGGLVRRLGPLIPAGPTTALEK